MKTEHDNRIAALYCRLSQEDKALGDSMSISSQKAILEAKAQEIGYRDYEFYIDDGYTGIHSVRPAFQQMLRDVEDGKIGCVITKDLSRLARNYLESGTYIEIFFPQHDVRYIAINDGEDSLNGSAEITPFKNILNEFYSRDVSKKVKSGKAIRAKQGKFMGTTAPFGYKKDPKDKNHLIADEETAPTVRYLFELALKGYGTNRINKILYDEKIPRPSYYKPEFFGKWNQNPDDIYDWKMSTAIRILRNPVYKGDMWLIGTDKKLFKQPTRGYVPLAERTIVKANHEPLVSEETWNAVQDILNRHTKVKSCCTDYVNVFRGLLKCPDCGCALLLHTDTRAYCKDKPAIEKTYFQCRTYRVKGARFCSQHRIDATDLHEAILADIRMHAEKVIKDRDKFVRNVMKRMGVRRIESADAIRKRVTELKAEQEEADRRYVKLYDDLSDGVIPESRFKLLSGKIEERQAKAREQIEALTRKLDTLESGTEGAEALADGFAECTTIKELSSELLNRLIEKIEVSDRQNVNGEKVQNIKVFYKFVGTID